MKYTFAGDTAFGHYGGVLNELGDNISAGFYIAACLGSAFKYNICPGIKCSPFYDSFYNNISSGLYAEIRSYDTLYFNAAFVFDITCGNIDILKYKNI